MPSQTHQRRVSCFFSVLLTTTLLLGSALVLAALCSGCAPQNIGRYNEIAFGDTKRVRNVIWQTYDEWYRDLAYWIQDEVDEEFEDFPGPTAADLRPPEGDYILGPGDVVQITIQDLVQMGVPYVQPVRITEEGMISLPFSYLRDVKAEDFTARGLERRLAERLLAPEGPLKDPRVSVFVLEYRNRDYSISGAIRNPGNYPIISYNMTLFYAINQASGLAPYHEQYIYVTRKMTEDELTELMMRAWSEGTEAEAPPSEAGAAADEAAEPGTPADEAPAKPAATDDEELQALAEGRMPEPGDTVPSPAVETPGDVPLPEPTEPAGTAAPAEGGKPDHVWKDNQWVPVKPAEGEAPKEKAEETVSPDDLPGSVDDLPPVVRKRLYRLGVVQGGDGLKRIIRIDIAALMAGDQTQNVVMRNGDEVNIPEPPAGEWYIDGEIVRRGVYSLTGRKITILQAVAAAGGLTQLAIPWRTELVRRVSDDAEEIIYVDLAKIARGEAPDFYLMPNDLIRIGTDQGAIWLAVLRNAFRATYGFGLVYDQNFADIYPWKGGIHPLFGD